MILIKNGPTMKSEELANRLLDFAVRIIRLTEALPSNYNASHIGKQLLRSGTSVGANYEEARGAGSGQDFLNKINISLKELRETLFWLKIIQKAELIKPARLEEIIKEADELCSILISSAKTIKKKS